MDNQPKLEVYQLERVEEVKGFEEENLPMYWMSNIVKLKGWALLEERRWKFADPLHALGAEYMEWNERVYKLIPAKGINGDKFIDWIDTGWVLRKLRND